MRTVASLALALGLVGDGAIAVRRREIPAEIAAWRVSLPEGRPALRGFRPDPPAGPSPAFDERMRSAAALVAKNLARDGLLATTDAALGILGPGDPSRLAAVGIPVDFLAHFRLESGESADAAVARGASVAKATFAFRPSVEGFVAASESGEEPIGIARVQITSADYWLAPGDGGSVDLVRQLLDALPDAEFVASIEEKHVEGFLRVASTWRVANASPKRLTLVPEALPVSQWAQDDGKPGYAPSGQGEGRAAVLLVPRYASRGEEGAALVPGDTFLAEGLASAGFRVVRSPLLFQGGDLLVARDPRTKERLLFVGEANIWRNTALGLSKEEVLEAFRVELGVDRCTVLPAISFHVDQELSLRAVGDRLVAFVPDDVAAVRTVLRCGLDALGRAGILGQAAIDDAARDLEAGKDGEFLSRVLSALASRCPVYGRFPESIANAFAVGAGDSGVGNLQRFLLATDLLSSRTLDPTQVEEGFDPHTAAYLRSFRRRDEERRALAAVLEKAGYEVVRIPSLPEEKRGIDYLNGVHDRDRYLMPAWGGLFSPLDESARAAFQKALGPGTAVVPVLTSESQRRGGGVHCSLSACAKP